MFYVIILRMYEFRRCISVDLVPVCVGQYVSFIPIERLEDVGTTICAQEQLSFVVLEILNCLVTHIMWFTV